MRKIEVIAFPRALSISIFSLFGNISALLIMHYAFSIEQSLFAYCLAILVTIFQYVGMVKKSESNLSTDNEDIYLFGIPAALRYQRSILGRRYIRITSLTMNGYHRVRVYESWVSKSDWQLMLEKCT